MSFQFNQPVAAILCGLGATAAPLAAAPVEFNRDVRPILADKCFACHGPDAKAVKGKLRLDLRERAVEMGAIVPGRPAASALVKRIFATDEADVMPPPETNKHLTDAQRETLRAWIEQGAEYQGHWAFLAPRRPAIPPVVNPGWLARNPIDAFILRKLAAKGLAPSPETDKTTLLRRVTMDLTGLPPTLAEVDAFLADRGAKAYENVVARLLDSKRYGEHFAKYWLDAVRYGDTHGLHLDNERSMWPYRDWVIGAFNQNLPYDVFTTWQLAGDLLPDPGYDQLTASGYNRCNITTSEGGAIKEEFLVRYAVDRTESTATIWMGLSAGCAVCHDHKFDPISQKEFYQLYAFFNNAADPAMDGNALLTPPILKLTTEDQKRQLADHDRRIKELEQQVAAELKKIDYAEPGPDVVKVADATGKGGAGAPVKPAEHVWIEDALPPGANVQTNAGNHSLEWSTEQRHSGTQAMRREARGIGQHFFTTCQTPLHIGTGDKLFAWVYLDPANPPKAVMLQYHSTGWHHRANWGDADAIPYGTKDTPTKFLAGDLPAAGRWVRLEVETEQIGLKPGAIVTGMAFTQFDGQVHWDTVGILSANRQPYEPPTDVNPADLVLHDEAREFVWVDDDFPAQANVSVSGHAVRWTEAQVHAGKRAMEREGTNVVQHYFDRCAQPLTAGTGDVLFAQVYLDPANPPTAVMLQYHSRSWLHRANWGDADAIPYGAKGTTQKHLAGDLPAVGRWVRLEIAAEKIGIRPGTRITGMAFTQHGGRVGWDQAGIISRVNQERPVREAARKPTLAEQALTSQAAWESYVKDELKFKYVPANVKTLVEKTPEPRRKPDQKREVTEYYLTHFHGPSRAVFWPLVGELDPLKQKREALDKAIPATFVFGESKDMREAFMLRRGEYDKPMDKVGRGVPAFLPPLPKSGQPASRLDLARWLLAPEHPLTARVTVNRFWQQFFGTGLVKTAEDFGSQGEWPSHPELLDWLATEFLQSGWNVKELVRLIVTSATYRQSSRVTPELLRADPENRLLARGPRFRFDAEVIRDQALAIGGLLVEKMGGRGVNPYQPPGLWEAVGYTRSTTANYKRDEGDALYRRSIYTFWKRTAPPASMALFDAPSREACTVRRERTNTPLQALTLMNDIQFMEASRALAERMMGEGGTAAADRVRHGFRLVTARAPTDAEQAVLEHTLRRHRARFIEDPEAAKTLIGVGESQPDARHFEPELAAMTMVANLLLNLDEAVTKN